MRDVLERLLAGSEQVAMYVPAIIVAAAILLFGYIFARQVRRWVEAFLKRTEFDRMASAGGLDEVMERAGTQLQPGRVLSGLLFWLMMLVIILLASAALGLDSINDMLRTMLGFVPTLIAGIVIVIMGMIVGEFVRGLILASAGTVPGVPTLAKIAKAAVVLIAVFMALQQVGVAEEIVTASFTLILGAVALAVGLAFGLGNTQLAGEVTRKWYEEGRRRDRRRTDRKGEVPPKAPEPPILD